jgi:hypothetical protein
MKRLLLIIIGFSAIIGRSQTLDSVDSTANPPNLKGYFRAGLSYTSDYVYAGRVDSMPAPYLTPSLSYIHNSGFFARATISYLTKSGEKRVDLLSFSAGYIWLNDNLYAGSTARAYLFNDSSYTVQSAVSASLMGYVGYDFYWVDVSFDGGLLFGNEIDYTAGIELMRTFYLSHKSWVIEPHIYLMAATQFYYSDYYNERSSQTSAAHGSPSGQSPTSANSKIELNEVEKFQWMSLEFSLPIYYVVSSLRFSVEPVYSIPLHPATITIDNITTVENLKNIFWAQLGVSYKF